MQIKSNTDELPEIPSHFSNFHFLIADDEEFNLYLLKNILNKWGVTYDEAFNGHEAAEIALNHSFNLILLDLKMPIMDGYEAAKVILKNNPFSKIIALTGTINPDEVEKIIQAGMLGYLQKPFTEWSLSQAISKIFPFESKENTPDILKRNPPVNLDELKKMTGDDADFFNEMLKIFIRSSENGLSSIQDNFNKANWSAISGDAHKLAAPAKHLNASILYNDLKKLESEAVSLRDIAEMEKLIASIENEILRVNSYLNTILSEE